MYITSSYRISFMLLAFLLVSSTLCLAQNQTSLKLNDVEINQRSGISLEEFQQLEEALLVLERIGNEKAPTFDVVKIYLARGARAIQLQTYIAPGDYMNIIELLRHARTGDRLVIEFIRHETAVPEDESTHLLNLALN